MKPRHFRRLAFLLLCTATSPAWATPEYAAFAGANCMSCHVGPIGGFGRKPLSSNDIGWISDKFFVSGDFQFMALYDQRPDNNRVVMFPMEASLHATLSLSPKLTLAASQDFGTLREAYGMLHNESQTLYARAGYFTLPYGLLLADHTAFVKEGRVKTGARNREERGIGAGLFGVRYKDSGVEVGYVGQPWFINLSMTSGIVGQEARSFPSSQSGTKKAITRRGGFLFKNVSLGVSMYNNDNELLDRRILRYGAFGWVKMGPVALIFEHDEGEEEKFTVGGSTQSSASYAELVWAFPFKGAPSYARLRYERLDPNRSLNEDVLQRIVASYRFTAMEHLAIESFYRRNMEDPVEIDNDDIFILMHASF